MKNSSTQIFSSQTFPLQGRRLIEASAGTGKTYNIANLYLRLLLEGDKPLTVDRILVVTFTRAATSELRGRIRDKIEQALRAFRRSATDATCEDVFIQTLLERYPGRELRGDICKRLNAALVCMDEACIFTIHGFAVQLIQTFLFETGALAEVELTEGDNHHLEQVLGDLWRQLQLSDCEPLRPYIEAADFKSPEDFRHYFRNMPSRAEILPAFSLSVPPEPLPALLSQLDQQRERSAAALFGEREALAGRWKTFKPLFEAEVTSGKSPLDGDETGELIACMESWFSGEDTKIHIPARNRRPYTKLNPLAKGEGPLAEFMAAVLQHAENSHSWDYYRKKVLLALLAQWLRAATAQPQLSSMQLDDVIRLINNTLAQHNQASRNLRNIITAHYPVCIVDECQDTDPEQFELFNSVYGNGKDSGFFMIGDPKQSIYAFRGADIFSYLELRSQVDKDDVFTLDTNFRSKQALVDATNALFEEKEFQENPGTHTFLYEGIEFSPVHSCEAKPHEQDKGQYEFQDCNQPLVFVGNPADPADKHEKFNRETLQRRFARDTAQRVAALLHPESGATITQNNHTQKLQAGDIAILVRNGTEARAVREALLQLEPPILTVYQSQRDSVFSTARFSEDLYHILRATEEPSDKRLLKAAIATPLYRGFAGDFQLLDALEQNDDFHETCIAEFHGYRHAWQQHGVLSALGLFMQERKLAEAFARQAEGDRLLTDFRHLGELLQQQAQQCSSSEELLIWYARQLQDDSALEADSKRIRLESDENLVKIVTIHVSKGLQYPVVFLPFFFLPRPTRPGRVLPFFHQQDGEHYHPRLDFSAPEETIEAAMRQEALAEDMRLLYVAITRGVYQCYIGISASLSRKTPQFTQTVWSHLLGIKEEFPSWEMIRTALQQKMSACEKAVAYRVTGDNSLPPSVSPSSVSIIPLLDQVSLPLLPPSCWVLTSYSALAHARRDPGFRHGASDEQTAGYQTLVHETPFAEVDKSWQDHIRYRLRSSSTTGDCLHAVYENLAQSPDTDILKEVQHQLQRHGLLGSLLTTEDTELVADWITQTLDTPLLENTTLANKKTLTLRHIYAKQQGLPELAFDFSIGSTAPASIEHGINKVLHRLNMPGISLPGQTEMEGLMAGSMDLLFIHDKKIYVLDYKSNSLGKAPRFYDRQNMDQAMQEHRYDLQYLVYSVAAHRYMQHRLGHRYAFDADDKQTEYCFGGVFYLFVRGMGLADYPQQGIWFHRPAAEQVLALDAAFKGENILSAGELDRG